MNDRKYGAIFVDSTAIAEFEGDFLGVHTYVLQALYAQIEKRKITLLNHPLLRKKIEHICAKSKLAERFETLEKGLQENAEVFSFFGLSTEEFTKEIVELDLLSKQCQQFDNFYVSATMLDGNGGYNAWDGYLDQTSVFHEAGIEDAAEILMLCSLCQYSKAHPDQRILLITGNNAISVLLDYIDGTNIETGNAIEALRIWLPISKKFQKIIDWTECEICTEIENVVFDCEREFVEDGVHTTVMNFFDIIAGDCQCMPLLQTPTRIVLYVQATLEFEEIITGGKLHLSGKANHDFQVEIDLTYRSSVSDFLVKNGRPVKFEPIQIYPYNN